MSYCVHVWSLMTWLCNSYLSHNLIRRDNLTADISFIYCFKRYYISHTLHISLMHIPLVYILSTFFFFPFFFPFPSKWNWDFYREKICKFAFASHACLSKVEGSPARSHVVILVNKVRNQEWEICEVKKCQCLLFWLWLSVQFEKMLLEPWSWNRSTMKRKLLWIDRGGWEMGVWRDVRNKRDVKKLLSGLVKKNNNREL